MLLSSYTKTRADTSLLACCFPQELGSSTLCSSSAASCCSISSLA